MSDQGHRTKSEKMDQVAECALSIIALHGIDSLTFSRLARAAEVSRPWLYKYVGGSPENVMEFAVDHFGRMFAYLDRPTETTRDGWIKAIVDGTGRIFGLVEAHPWIIQLYFRYFGSSTLLGERMVFVKEQYLRKACYEIENALGYDGQKARMVAETITSTQLSLSFHWLNNHNKEEIFKNTQLEVLGTWLRSLN